MPTTRTRRLLGSAVERDGDEEHRSATPLELLFDLTFVVAVGAAADGLHHELVAGHVADGVLGFAMGFFGVWWAWMNYTWFASAHDSDDLVHRLLTLVQIAGVLVFATGISSVVEDNEFLVVTVGYGIMRIGLSASWLRVAMQVPARRERALRYAGLIAVLQILWFARLALAEDWLLPSFIVLCLGELLVPVVAERAAEHAIFHAEHIRERYGLFTIIVLGESILSATAGFQAAVNDGGMSPELFQVEISALLLAFAAWWLYFDHPAHLVPTFEQSFRWGYGHVFVFAALASAGAGIYVAADSVVHHENTRIAALSVAVPMAMYVAGLALVLKITRARVVRIYPKVAAGVLMIGVGSVASVGTTVSLCALVMTGLVVWMIIDSDRTNQALLPTRSESASA